MTIYKERTAGFFKWVLAIFIFIFGMTFTTSEVEGVNLSNKNPDYVTQKKVEDRNTVSTDPSTDRTRTVKPNDGNTAYPDEHNNNNNTNLHNDLVGGDQTGDTAIPEPSTIILLSSGLGMLYFNRRRNNKK